MTTLSLLVLLGLLIWFWQDSLRAREAAKAACARVCTETRVQLLDDTVALETLWLRRDDKGRLQIERIYVFEFTDTGNTRRQGSVNVLGRKIRVVAMEGGDLLIP